MIHKKIIRSLSIAIIAIALLLLATLLENEMKWTLVDFTIAGILVFSACLLYELISPKFSKTWHRVTVGIALGATLLLIWVQLAAGII